MNEYVVVSDIHLGSNVCRAEVFLDFLDRIETETLILNGDIFDNMDFRRLKKKHWKILKKIRSIAKNNNVIWISGNHDYEAEVIAHIIGAIFLLEYEIKTNDKKILITHGDRFDDIITKRPILTRLADNFYRIVQKIDKVMNNNYYYSGLLKRNSKTFSRCTEKTIRRSVQYAIKKNFDAIIIGHLHQAAHLTNFENSIEYINCGCWTDQKCHFITINQDKIELKEFTVNENKSNRQ